MEIRMVDLVSQYQDIKQEIDQALERVITDSRFINGPDVQGFSNSLAQYLEVGHVIPCANGTDALQLALMALELPQGSEVLTPSFNYVAAAEMLPIVGLVPRFFDSRPDSLNLDEELIEGSITEKTKAIIAVHLFGQGCDMDRIMEIAKKHNLIVIEDNAQSIGGTFTFRNGTTKKLGSIGHIGTTSFFPSKNLGCYGDGGAVMTNDEGLAKKIRMFGNHGQVKKYEYELIGINSRLDTMQAAILNIKLQRLDVYIEARRKAAGYYDLHLSDIEHIETPFRNSFSRHVFHQYNMKVKNGRRDELQDFLKGKGIPSMIYYPRPLHMSTAYDQYPRGPLPVAESLMNEVLALPMHTHLTEEMQEYICTSIQEFFSKA